MGRDILVVAAHPDDEVLGCGGTIAKHVQQGDRVHVAILGEGLTSRTQQRDTQYYGHELDDLREAAKLANQVLGVTSLELFDLPDNRMDSMDLLDVVKVIEGLIQRFNPMVVYTHHAGDVNIDHQILHSAVITACRPLPGSSVETILYFEVASSTEWQTPGSAAPFIPNWFVDISSTLALKVKAMEIYAAEMREWPHPRSVKAVEHLAHWRGATVGVNAAEVFVTGRNIVK